MSVAPLAYLNGQMIPAARACLPVFDSGIVLGATVSEQARTFGKRLYRLEQHLERLFRSLRTTGMDPGLSCEEFTRIAQELAAHNGALLDRAAELGLVIFVTAGPYSTYAPADDGIPASGASVCLHTFPLPFRLWSRKLREGVRLVTPAVRQVPPCCWPPDIKHRSRLHFYLAEHQARQVDPEASALLLDLEGNVAETPAANFLMVRGGVLRSPAAANCLPGVSRAVVRELAGTLGIPFQEQTIPAAELPQAEEAFLASTPYCLLPVTRINGTPVGAGRPGPVFRRLLSAWSEQVGVDIEHQILQAR